MFLEILFWLLLVLSLIGLLPGEKYTWAPRLGWGVVFVLFIIVGIRLFGLSSLTH
jgi:hypothetical protein